MGRPQTHGLVLSNNLPRKSSVWRYEPTANKSQCKKFDNYFVDVDFCTKTKIRNTVPLKTQTNRGFDKKTTNRQQNWPSTIQKQVLGGVDNYASSN